LWVTDGPVYAIVVDGSTIYIGGLFTYVASVSCCASATRNNIAALDAATGAVTPWNPDADGQVSALVVSGGTVYVGGLFTSIGGEPRSRIAALDAASGAATTWNPNVTGGGYQGGHFMSGVYSLAVNGGTVYAGGSFTGIGGAPRSHIAALDAATGAATAWNPGVCCAAAGYDPYVTSVAASGGTVYAAGLFSSIGGQGRNALAAIDATTGAATAWNPNPNVSPVLALAVSGGTVYVGGYFGSIGGQPRHGIAAFDAATGAATAWNPNASGSDPRVYALAVSGSTVYAGGWFTSIGGRPRNRIAALDAATGAATDWNPDANLGVYALAVGGGKVYAGGRFTRIGGQPRPFLAAIPSGICPSVAMSFDFSPSTINLQSMGHWVTGTLEPEPPALPADIDIASIRLNGSVPVDASAATSIGDADSDGRPDLTVKFDRAALELSVAEGDSVPVTVSGTIGQGCFSATVVIRVKRGHVTAPTAGDVLQGGGTTDVRWDTPDGVDVQSVAVLWSSDDGASWSLVAEGLPNSGSYLWSLPTSGTSSARVAVVLVESTDPSGSEVTGVLAVSERFAITAPLGVIGPGVELALHGPVTNPSANLRVSFTLPDAEPASLVAYDVSGREVMRSAVGSMGAGRHVVTLGTSRTLATGVYLVQLIRGDRRLGARAVVVR
jgi:hypothetical protein